MKCPHCGGEMSLEDLVCPYCGMPNEEAAQHAHAMRYYKESYQRTEAEVREKTGRQSARFVKILISLVLILLSVGAIWFGQNAYHFQYERQRTEAVKNADAYCAALDDLVEQGDYIGFVDSDDYI